MASEKQIQDGRLPKLELHVAADKYCKPGEAHLIIAPMDYLKVQEFFKKHFEMWVRVHEACDALGSWPTSYLFKFSEPVAVKDEK